LTAPLTVRRLMTLEEVSDGVIYIEGEPLTHMTRDGELVRRIRDGDRTAFSLLVERYQKTAYFVALSVTGKHEDAEDAAQESFMAALQKLDECRKPERFKSWFLTIVRNRSKNLVRRESLRSMGEVPPGTRSPDPTPDRMAETSNLREALDAALETLTEEQRQVVILHEIEGWKHREIAKMLSMPAGTIRSHLHFARKKLRRELTVRGFAPPGQEELT